MIAVTYYMRKYLRTNVTEVDGKFSRGSNQNPELTAAVCVRACVCVCVSEVRARVCVRGVCVVRARVSARCVCVYACVCGVCASVSRARARVCAWCVLRARARVCVRGVCVCVVCASE